VVSGESITGKTGRVVNVNVELKIGNKKLET